MILVEDEKGIDRQWDATHYEVWNGILTLHRDEQEVAMYAAGSWRFVCPKPEIERGRE